MLAFLLEGLGTNLLGCTAWSVAPGLHCWVLGFLAGLLASGGFSGPSTWSAASGLHIWVLGILAGLLASGGLLGPWHSELVSGPLLPGYVGRFGWAPGSPVV